MGHRRSVGKRLIVIGIWAGLGILAGMQLGGTSGSKSTGLPGWDTDVQTAVQTEAQTEMSGNVSGSGGVKGNPGALSPADSGLPAQSGGSYVYIPPQGGAIQIFPAPQEGTSRTDASQGAMPEAPQLYGEADLGTRTPEQILLPEAEGPAVDVLAEKTAGLLQRASREGIRWVVSLFGAAE
ncbi:hypothetical protein ACE6ED_17655 [Paenibacillus sp. CN-4]|uniref:hypothetical protein n=1 Tax=Paenibacillus nanchangensis TaxID=3348343 RepID=UPI00397A4189